MHGSSPTTRLKNERYLDDDHLLSHPASVEVSEPRKEAEWSQVRIELGDE